MSRPTYLFLQCILGIVLAGMVGGTFILGVWISDRTLPVDVVETRLVTRVVKPGDYLVIQQRLNYDRNCGGHIDRFLYDGAQFRHRKQLEDIDYSSPPDGLGEKTLTTRERVPEDFEEGPAYYTATPLYYCNWVHRVFWPIDRRPTVVQFQVKR